MENSTAFSTLNSLNISKSFNSPHNFTTKSDGFKESTLLQALRDPECLAGSVFLFLLSIVSIIGNILVCRTIFVTKRLHIPGYYFVASLAGADFLVGIFPTPLILLYHVTLKMKGKFNWKHD